MCLSACTTLLRLVRGGLVIKGNQLHDMGGEE